MNIKTLIPLIVALALGLVAAMMGKNMIGKGRGDGGPGVKTAKQVVAKEDLAPGSTIKETDLVLKDMPADASSPHGFGSIPEVIGRVVTTQIVKGQAIMNTLLAPAGTTGGLPAMIPAGMRAVTIEVNEVSGLAGLLIPGARVDLVQTIQAKRGDQDMMAKTLVENLQVVAVGRRMSTVASGAPEGEPIARSVTLFATAEQAEAIDLASHVGSPRLVLRNAADKGTTASKGVTVADLRGEEKSDSLTDELIADLLWKGDPTTRPVEVAKADPPKAAVAGQAEPKKTFREVEVIRGGQVTSVRVNLVPATAITGTADKLFGDAPQEPIDE
jgi:pilus assembly protein CpaB